MPFPGLPGMSSVRVCVPFGFYRNSWGAVHHDGRTSKDGRHYAPPVHVRELTAARCTANAQFPHPRGWGAPYEAGPNTAGSNMEGYRYWCQRARRQGKRGHRTMKLTSQ